METSHRLERAKCLPSGTKVLNGDNKNTRAVNIARRVHCEHRFGQCVPACTDTPKLTKVPLLCDQPWHICLQSSSIRPEYQSLGFHKNKGCSSWVLQMIRKSSDIKLSRQHFAETPVTRGFSKGGRNPAKLDKFPRLQDEPWEIRAGTITDLCTPRHEVSKASESSLSDPQEDSGNLGCSPGHSKISVSVNQTVPASSRLIQRSSQSAQTGLGISETAVVCIGRTLDASDWKFRGPGTSNCGDCPSIGQMDRYGWRKAFHYGHSQHRCLSAQIQVFLAGVHTCYHRFVWHTVLGPVQKEITTWQEMMMAVWKALQQWELELQGKAVMILSENTSAVLYRKNQGGMHSRALSDLICQDWHWCSNCSMELKTQHIPRRLNVLADSLSRNRQIILTEWFLHPTVFEKFGLVSGNPHVDLFEMRWNHKLPKFVLPFPNQQVWETDALSTERTGMFAYVFPPVVLVPNVTELPLAPGPLVGTRIKIQKTAETKCMVLLTAPLHWYKSWMNNLLELCMEVPRKLPVRADLLKQPWRKPFHQESCQGRPEPCFIMKAVSSRPSISKSTCLEVVRPALQRKKFSTAALVRISAARRPPTLKVYEGKWNIFVKWCKQNSLDSLTLTVPQLAEFFLGLFETRKLSPITIRGYRSMIADTYRHHGLYEVGKDKDLSDLMVNFDRSRPKTSVLFPCWNLARVLTWLNSQTFELLDSASVSDLTLKTCFLISLASACWISEVHALSTEPDYLQFRDDGSVLLLTHPAFISKNRLPSVGAQSACVHPLPVERDSSEILHDLVCALTIYPRRTKPWRDGGTRLFLPIKQRKRDILLQIISSCLKVFSYNNKKILSNLKFLSVQPWWFALYQCWAEKETGSNTQRCSAWCHRQRPPDTKWQYTQSTITVISGRSRAEKQHNIKVINSK